MRPLGRLREPDEVVPRWAVRFAYVAFGVAALAALTILALIITGAVVGVLWLIEVAP